MNESKSTPQIETPVPAQVTTNHAPSTEEKSADRNFLSRSDLVSAINSEIKQIEDENKRPGWSVWALQGGIATLVWLALADFSPQSNFKTIGLVFLLGSFFGDFLLTACEYVNGLGKQKQVRLRYKFLGDNPDSTPAILVFMLVRYSLMLVAYLLLGSDFHIPSLAWYCAVPIVLCLVLLPLRFLKILSLKKELSKFSSHLSFWLVIFWSGILSYQLFHLLPLSESDYRASDFRMGILLVGIFYLFWLLTTGEKERPTVNALKNIRRELAFGLITVEAAAKEADIVLSGLTASAAIEHKLAEISSEFHKVIQAYQKLLVECGIADALLKKLESSGDRLSNTWKEDARKVANLIDSCERIKASSQQLYTFVFYRTKSALRSVESISEENLNPKPELALKWKTMKEKMGKMFELHNSSKPLLDEIKARYILISPAIETLTE